MIDVHLLFFNFYALVDPAAQVESSRTIFDGRRVGIIKFNCLLLYHFIEKIGDAQFVLQIISGMNAPCKPFLFKSFLKSFWFRIALEDFDKIR